jgi:hypothetical protein
MIPPRCFAWLTDCKRVSKKISDQILLKTIEPALIVSGFGTPKLLVFMTRCNRIERRPRQCPSIEAINIHYSTCMTLAISISVIQTLNLQHDKNVVSVSTILERAKRSLATGHAIDAEALPRLGSNPKPQRRRSFDEENPTRCSPAAGRSAGLVQRFRIPL